MNFHWTRRSKGFPRGGKHCGVLMVAVAVQFLAGQASAESMDFALERLVTNDACHTNGLAQTDGNGDFLRCQPDEEAFVQLINQFGMALAPTSMYPARTTGYGGFEISLEGAYTTVNGDGEYMARGTRGAVSETTGEAATKNASPDSMLQLYSLRIRKGFGFGFETGLTFGFMPNTSLISGGADLRLAILEGFRDGLPGYLPDLAATGSVRTITGSSQVQLTVVGVSGVASKPITILDSGVLTPWVGYQHLFIYGDSGVIDFTPNESALQGCGYGGSNVPGTPGSNDFDGSPICDPAGSVEDFNNNQVFDPVRLQRQRLLFGLNYRYEILNVGAQVMADVFNSAVNLNDDEAEVFQKEKDEGGNVGNFAFSLQVGAQF